MYIDKMTKKEKKDRIKEEISDASEELLDALLLDFGYEYSEDEEED